VISKETYGLCVTLERELLAALPYLLGDYASMSITVRGNVKPIVPLSTDLVIKEAASVFIEAAVRDCCNCSSAKVASGIRPFPRYASAH
jgi:redox-regulated HSP33 family molecular chaperone